jgi:uncharacterized protein (TIGR03083 family)
MDVAAHLEQLAADGALLAEAAERAGWDAAVPSTDWDVRQLVTHVGGVHRWAAAIVRTAAPDSLEEVAATVGTGPPDAELLEWFRSGHAELLATLRAAPADLDCFTFLPAPSPLAFWARRQAHETAVHRADAQCAAGAITPYPTAFAQDGIAELLQGFARRRSNAVATPGRIALRPDDGGSPWLVTLGGDKTMAEPDDGAAEGVVRGSSSDLYLWLWNRPAQVAVTGDASLAAAWRQVRVRWSWRDRGTQHSESDRYVPQSGAVGSPPPPPD